MTVLRPLELSRVKSCVAVGGEGRGGEWLEGGCIIQQIGLQNRTIMLNIVLFPSNDATARGTYTYICNEMNTMY
jgi:hypothetical protein